MAPKSSTKSATTARTSKRTEPVSILSIDELPAATVRPSEAQRMFAALPGSLAQIAKPIDATRQSVDQWRKGACVPEDRYRRAIASHYGIPFGAWGLDEPEPDLDDELDDDDEA